jgi:meso-butanediol dehydrogenase / (S,S)-butanediol dehydrogenase / diacetyl reductase
VGFQRFEGKLVIVTGAGSGMGAVTARRFRDESAAVVLTRRPREKLTNVVSQFDQGRNLLRPFVPRTDSLAGGPGFEP